MIPRGAQLERKLTRTRACTSLRCALLLGQFFPSQSRSRLPDQRRRQPIRASTRQGRGIRQSASVVRASGEQPYRSQPNPQDGGRDRDVEDSLWIDILALTSRTPLDHINCSGGRETNVGAYRRLAHFSLMPNYSLPTGRGVCISLESCLSE